MAQCLICKKEVDEKRWLQAGGDVDTYEGKTYYFCGLQHKMKFLRDRVAQQKGISTPEDKERHQRG